MKCPRCSAAIVSPPDAAGLFVCPGCGIRLKRAPPVAKQDTAALVGAEPGHGPAPVAEGELDADKVLARLDPPASPAATLPPGTPLKPIARPDDGASPRADVLGRILAELQALRRAQEQVLCLLQARPSGLDPDELPHAAGDAAIDVSAREARAPLRSRRRKSVLLIDDDETTRQAAVAALERAEVPVRTAADGNSGLAALAKERSDVIVLELDVGGSMPGKDVINLIKATMEWVDIPIVLYTRVAVADQKEARTVHGADEFVSKSAPRAAERLAAQIVGQFRKG